MFVWDANVSWTGVTTFVDNVADLGGGAVYATINARIICRGTTVFRNNTVTAGNGGAISIHGSATTDRGSHVHLSEDTTFANNYASAIGGAISSSASTGGQYFENVTFRSNSASIGGAIATFDNGNANEGAAETTVCLGCQFISNSAAGSSLAVAAFGSVEINDSYFLGNVLSCDEGLYVKETTQVRKTMPLQLFVMKTLNPAISGTSLQVAKASGTASGVELTASVFPHNHVEPKPCVIRCQGRQVVWALLVLRRYSPGMYCHPMVVTWLTLFP